MRPVLKGKRKGNTKKKETKSKSNPTYLALQNTETTLKNVHDWVIDTLPVVDDLVVMNACNEKHWAVVLARLVYTLLLSLFCIPAILLCTVLFALCD